MLDVPPKLANATRDLGKVLSLGPWVLVSSINDPLSIVHVLATNALERIASPEIPLGHGRQRTDVGIDVPNTLLANASLGLCRYSQVPEWPLAGSVHPDYTEPCEPDYQQPR